MMSALDDAGMTARAQCLPSFCTTPHFPRVGASCVPIATTRSVTRCRADERSQNRWLILRGNFRIIPLSVHLLLSRALQMIRLHPTCITRTARPAQSDPPAQTARRSRAGPSPVTVRAGVGSVSQPISVRFTSRAPKLCAPSRCIQMPRLVCDFGAISAAGYIIPVVLVRWATRNQLNPRRDGFLGLRRSGSSLLDAGTRIMAVAGWL